VAHIVGVVKFLALEKRSNGIWPMAMIKVLY
jgi:hypothetical protein